MAEVDGRLFAFENMFWKQNMMLDFIKIMQISEVVLQPGGLIFDHRQVCNEITYVVSGAGYFYTEGAAMRAGYGDVHVVSKGQHHKIIGDENEKLRYICIGFNFGEIPDDFVNIAAFFANSPSFLLKSEGDIRHLFDMMINEFYQNTAEKTMVLEHIIKLILIRVYQKFINSSKKLNSERNSIKKKSSTVYGIIKYIDINIYNVKSVREIAAALNFTENYISHIFKARMGISLSAYIKQRKVQTARALLENQNMTLTEIAEILNFDSVQSLSRAFKQEYSKTPTQYLIELKESGN